MIPVHQHHVPGVEVPVQEGVGRFGQEVRLQAVEVVLQEDLVELHADELQEVVLEIVQVEIHHPGVEGGLRIADREIQPAGALDLDLREGGEGLAQQRDLVRPVFPEARPAASASYRTVVPKSSCR